MNRRPTIKEVAKLAGVSFKTVARVVNDEGVVTPETREAVLSAMRMLHYVPNVSARQLRTNRSYLIALLWQPSSEYGRGAATGIFYRHGVQEGALQRCRELGYHLLLEEAPAGLETEIAARLQNLRIDGVLVTPPLSLRPAMQEALKGSGLRVVLMSTNGSDAGFASVRMDDVSAAAEVVRRLADLGHRRIGFIGVSDRPALLRRHQGFVQALAACGLPRNTELEVPGDLSFEAGEAGAAQLLGLDEPPTAIFAGTDAMALGVLVAAAKLGFAVPGDVSVVGFDDSPLARVVSPQLTTVRQPLVQMARAGVDLLVSKAAAAPPPALVLPFEFVDRASTAPPRAAEAHQRVRTRR